MNPGIGRFVLLNDHAWVYVLWAGENQSTTLPPTIRRIRERDATRSTFIAPLFGLEGSGEKRGLHDAQLWRSVDVGAIGKWECGAVCVKPLQDENASLPSSPAPQPSELQVEIGKWVRDLGPLPKPLSTTDIQASKEGSDLRVAYLGSPGAFSEVAALKAYPQSETVPCEQIEVVFKAVELWVVDKAVLPIENTVAGSIHHNYDLLLCHRLHIAFSQCGNVLTKLSVILENTDDTAAAAQLISSKSLKDAGAIASVHAAQLYGLNILEKGIQAMFLFLQTSIVLTLEEGPGMLFKALAVFAMRKINLTKIESRPQRNRPLRVVDDLNHGTAKYFDYLFHIDFEASMADPIAQNALSHLQEYTTFLRVLGSYPSDTSLCDYPFCMFEFI
ncbi:hypothetical protein HPP92_013712 [Vanilla planifolia]|uniref:arogenate dehydratase n=1 Tax=Vanilla planifolia TaxID=51239 RepID=A0A835QW33_VANPL|nr:hypothetical protein HPP92_013712 [Vanilla planifolia]